MTITASPAPLIAGTALMTNGPDGAEPVNCRTLFTYRSTALGTAELPASVGTG
ncbi:hypothetical protein Q8F57_039050 [Paraburkholderia terrae]|uniref:hypothetical protein n=1 Tax=Paraburkholderia terrae TaxID=311230 RepID=UPI00296B2B2F|nr:hypothetical protein [Paraburkholderia terrae]MDW3661361.1 hypothetical protein [Paraburkholderia terrae]